MAKKNTSVKIRKSKFRIITYAFCNVHHIYYDFLMIIGSDEMVKNDQQKEHNTHEVRKHSQLYICDHFEGIK